jgi:predicted flap endonuclease-1-like 5' DNA nuclease
LQWMLYVVLAFFLLMVIVGWWVASKKKNQPEAEHDVHVHDSHKADDLVKIEGIGPKVAKVLGEAGITTFDQLAHADISNIQKVLKDAGLQMMNPEGWIDQAKLAAKGDWAAFEKLQSELKGGRKVNT